MRGILHSDANYVINHELGLSCSMGDDNVGRDKVTPEHRAHWKSLGCIIEEKGETVEIGEPVTFTSHLYDLDTCTAVYNNGVKLLLRLAYMHQQGQRLTAEQANGVRFAVRGSEFATRVDDFIRSDPHTIAFLDVDVEGPDAKIDLVGFC